MSWSTGRPRTPLVTRLLAAITAVLAISFVLTFVVETNFTRNALRAQSVSLLEDRANQARSISLGDIQPVHEELQFVNQRFQDVPPGRLTPADRAQLIGILNDVHARRPFFTSLGMYDRSGDPLVPTIGDTLAPPPPAAYEADKASFAVRVVPTLDGGLAYVSSEVVGEAPNEVLVVFGYAFDPWYARSLRDATRGADIVLEADGEVVATSLPVFPTEQVRELGRESSDPSIGIVEVAGEKYWGDFRPITQPEPSEDWGMPARLGVLVPEPLGALDAQLLTHRLLAGAALLVIATLLAWIVSARMTRPLRELTTTAARIADGDVDAEFRTTSDDEVGVLAQSLEEMRRGIRDQVALIQRQAEALRDAGGRLVHAQDEARRRMAGDLHDGVQRQLVMLRLHIGFGRERLRREPDAVDEVLDELSGEIDQVLGRLRETAQGIYPSILRDRGLEGALFSLGARSRLPVDLEVEPEPLPRLPHDVEANTYFLASEAVTNAVKHGEANRVVVTVRVDGEMLLLTVQDDGGGFDVASVADGRGLGNIHDRARALGGKVEVASGPSGTVVTARLPIGRSVAGPLEEEQHRRDAAVELDVLAQAELLEDGVDVLLDRAFRDPEVARDPAVPLAGRHERQDVELSRREPREP